MAVQLAGAGPDDLFDTADDLTFDPQLSAVGGAFAFSALTSGSYRLSTLVPPGTSLTGGSNPLLVTLAEDEHMSSAEFGLQQVDASVAGKVFADADASGALDAGELGLAGATVTLSRDSSVVATGTSAADGSFAFGWLTAGSYVVDVAPPFGWSLTTLSTSAAVTIVAGEPNGDVRFGFREALSVGDEVFLDVNENGERDAGESGVANVLVTLDSGSADVETTRSSLNGSYRFADVLPGSYTVSVTAPPGSSVTTASSLPVLVEGVSITDIDFGLGGVPLNPGAVTTVAGNGSSATVDGVGSAAAFRSMGGIVSVGSSVYVFSSGAVRQVDKASASVTTLAGSASSTGCVDSATPSQVRFKNSTKYNPGDVVSDATYLYVLDGECQKIRRVSLASGETTTITSGVALSTRMTLAGDGYLYLFSKSDANVYRVDPATGVKTVFVTLPPPQTGYTTFEGGPITGDDDALWIRVKAMTAQSAVDYFIVRVGLANGATSVLASGTAVVGGTWSNNCFCVSGALVSVGDYVYGVAGNADRMVRRWSKLDGSYIDVAGTDRWPGSTPTFSDGTGTEAFFMKAISGLAFDGARLWIPDPENFRLRVITPAAPLPSSLPSPATQTASPVPAVTWTFAGSGIDATVDGFGSDASFRAMDAVVAVDGAVYVATDNAIRKVDTGNGQVTTLAGANTSSGWSLCTDSDDPTAVRFGPTLDVTSDGTSRGVG